MTGADHLGPFPVHEDAEGVAVTGQDGLDRGAVAGMVDRPVWLHGPGSADGRPPGIRVCPTIGRGRPARPKCALGRTDPWSATWPVHSNRSSERVR